MSRLIDAEKLTHYLAVNEDDKQFFYVKSKDIDRLPTVDPVHAAEGCYCGECVNLGSSVYDDDLFYCHYWGYSICEDDYCSRGERREEND